MKIEGQSGGIFFPPTGIHLFRGLQLCLPELHGDQEIISGNQYVGEINKQFLAKAQVQFEGISRPEGLEHCLL